jgi:drug/metabolite transporter (DMT)-like permease
MVTKISITLLILVAFICVGVGASLQYHYMWNMPRTPHPELNRTYPFHVHGAVVYLTKEEYKMLEWLHRIAIISFMIICTIFIILLNKKGKNELKN